MNPYYDIVRLMREQKSERVQFMEGTIYLEPTRVEVMGEVISARFAFGIGELYDGAGCLVWMGMDDNVAVAVW
jgi:hypothetical protein